MSNEICKSFPVTEMEYRELDAKFGQLAEFAAWQLIKKNSRNNHTNEQADIAQELRISIITAGSYYKRQVYIENCLELAQNHVKDSLSRHIVDELVNLWKNKTRHGANRQKFGPHQEAILEKLVKKFVPKKLRPSKNQPLKLDSKFSTYCKAITWNTHKYMGKKITREKSFRVGQVSLSEFDYLTA